MDKIGKKDLIQILGLGTFLLFLILPSYWLSQFLLHKTLIYSFLGGFYIYLFPFCFLFLGMIQGLLWQNKMTGEIPFAIWVIVFAMLSCFIFYQFILQFMYQSGFSWGGLLIFVSVTVHGLLVWIGLKLIYYK